MDPEKPSLNETDEKLRDIWVQLDPSLRARAVNLMSQMAYNFAIAQLETTLKGDNHEREIESEKDST